MVSPTYASPARSEAARFRESSCTSTEVRRRPLSKESVSCIVGEGLRWACTMDFRTLRLKASPQSLPARMHFAPNLEPWIGSRRSVSPKRDRGCHSVSLPRERKIPDICRSRTMGTVGSPTVTDPRIRRFLPQPHGRFGTSFRWTEWEHSIPVSSEFFSQESSVRS